MHKKTYIITMVLVAAFILSGCMGKTQKDQSFREFAYGNKSNVNLTSEQHVKVADGYASRDNPEMALLHYNKAISLEEANLSARVKRGDLLSSQGMDEQALSEYNYVLKAQPDNANANESAGGVYFRAGLYKEALAHLNKAVALDSSLWKAHNYLGVLHDREHRYDKAVEHFSRALVLHTGSGVDEIYNNLGVVLVARKEYGMAVDAFRMALKSGGASTRTYNNLGLALARLGRLEEALESFKYAGGEARAHNNLGYVLLTDNKPNEAVPYFEKAIELSPNYYVKAADNLKRARMAARFEKVVPENSGSTPNPLLRQSFPDAKQNPGGPAASPASVGSPPPPSKIEQISYEKVDLASPPLPSRIKSMSLKRVGFGGRYNVGVSYGLHVSSWRGHTGAFKHCAMLKQQGFDTWVNQVDLGEKGTWYRVLVGNFASIMEARTERSDVLDILDVDRALVYVRDMPGVGGFDFLEI